MVCACVYVYTPCLSEIEQLLFVMIDKKTQVTILVAADGALKFPKITRPADLEAVLEKLNSIPAREIQVWRIFSI